MPLKVISISQNNKTSWSFRFQHQSLEGDSYSIVTIANSKYTTLSKNNFFKKKILKLQLFGLESGVTELKQELFKPEYLNLISRTYVKSCMFSSTYVASPLLQQNGKQTHENYPEAHGLRNQE